MYWGLAIILALQVGSRACRSTERSPRTAPEELAASQLEPHTNRDVSKVLIPLRGADIEPTLDLTFPQAKNSVKLLSKKLKNKKQLVEIVPINRKGGHVEKSLAYIVAAPKVSKKHRDVTRIEESSRSEEFNESGHISDEHSGDMITENDEEVGDDTIGSHFSSGYYLQSSSQEDSSSEENDSDGNKNIDYRKSDNHVYEVNDDSNNVEVQRKRNRHETHRHEVIDGAPKDHHHVRSEESEDSVSDIIIRSKTKYDVTDSMQDKSESDNGSGDSEGSSADISGAHNEIKEAYYDTNEAKSSGNLVDSEEFGHGVYIDTNDYPHSNDVSNNFQEFGINTFSTENVEKTDRESDYADKDMTIENIFIERNGNVDSIHENTDFLHKSNPEKDLIEFVEAPGRLFGDKYGVLKEKNMSKSGDWYNHQFKTYRMSFIFNR